MSNMTLLLTVSSSNLIITATSVAVKNLIQKYPMMNSKQYTNNSPSIPNLSKADEVNFNESKKNFESIKDKITFDDSIITDELKKSIPYNVDENFLKKGVSGIPNDTLKEKYIFDVEKNNDEGTITLRVFGRALHFEEKSEDFETYTALLWEKVLTGFAQFSIEEIINERSIGIHMFEADKYMKDLSEECTKRTANKCADLLKKSRNEKKVTNNGFGTGFIAQKKKDQPIYYMGTNSHVITKILSKYQEYLNKAQEKNKYKNKDYFNLKKNHNIDATELSQFFSFTQNDNFFNTDNKKIKSVRLLQNFENNDDNFFDKSKFVAIDLAILKIEFTSKEDDPLEKWWSERPTRIRAMDMGDFLNGYDPNNDNDRPDLKQKNNSLEKGMKIAQPFFIGSYGNVDPVCYAKPKNFSQKFRIHIGHSRNDWKIMDSKFFNTDKEFGKAGSINYVNRADSTFFGSSGSGVYDKNLNLVGVNYKLYQKHPKNQVDNKIFCTQKTLNFKSAFQWLSFNEKAKDFFNLKDNSEVIDFVSKNQNWKKDNLNNEQINEKLYDYSDLTFGDLNKVEKPKEEIKEKEPIIENYWDRKSKEKYVVYLNSTPKPSTHSWHWSDIRWFRYVKVGGF